MYFACATAVVREATRGAIAMTGSADMRRPVSQTGSLLGRPGSKGDRAAIRLRASSNQRGSLRASQFTSLISCLPPFTPGADPSQFSQALAPNGG